MGPRKCIYPTPSEPRCSPPKRNRWGYSSYLNVYGDTVLVCYFPVARVYIVGKAGGTEQGINQHRSRHISYIILSSIVFVPLCVQSSSYSLYTVNLSQRKGSLINYVTRDAAFFAEFTPSSPRTYIASRSRFFRFGSVFLFFAHWHCI